MNTQIEPDRLPLANAHWDGATLVIDNAADLKKIRRKHLSVSASNSIQQCPASFAAGRLLPRSENPFDPAPLGTATHEVMEHLYQLKPHERTPEFISGELRRLSQHIEASERDRWLSITLPRAMGIYSIENPAQVDVYATEMAVGGYDFQAKKMREIQVSLPGLTTEVPFIGLIDRVDRGIVKGTNVLRVRDYKFPGSKPRVPNPNWSDPYAEQLRIYSAVVEKVAGEKPFDAMLLYPGWGHTRVIDISDEATRKSLNKFENSWNTQNRACDTGQFQAKPSALCAWCPLANMCPVAKITTEKGVGVAAEHPTAAQLGIRVTRVHKKLSPHAASTGFFVTESEPAPQPTETTAQAAQPPVPVPQSDTTVHNNNQAGTPAVTQEKTMSTLQYPANNYAAMAVCTLADVATEHLAAASQPLSPTTMDAFTTVLAEIALTVTRKLFGAADFGHAAFGRVEFSLRSSLKVIPAPFGADEQAWVAWRQRIATLTAAKITTAMNLLNADAIPADAYTVFTRQPVNA